MKYAVDQTHVRSINQRIILDRIFQTDSISRAALSRLIHISKSAMTENIAALLNTGIIQEIGAGSAKSTGGRKPILLQFNRDYAHIIAIDLNYADPIFVLANLGGDIINRFTISVTASASYETRLELVKNAIATLMASVNLRNAEHTIIAISCPGIYHPASGEFRINQQFANWNIPLLSKQLEELFQTKVLIANDVNAAAVGELRYGIGKGAENLLYVSCGLGLGAGIIINGALYEGTWNGAGEIANFIIFSPEGCCRLEPLVNIDSLFRRLQSAPEQTRQLIFGDADRPDFKNVTDAWSKGDPAVRKALDEIAYHLGCAISNVISLLNCDRVIWGGEYRVFQEQMLPIINQVVKQNAFYPIEVVASSLSRDSGIYGLFALATEEIFQDLCGSGARKNNAGDHFNG